LETFILQDDIDRVFPECGPFGDNAVYPFCIRPNFLFKNTSNNDGIIELRNFHIHALPGAYKIRCSANLASSKQEATFWVSLIGSVAAVDASFNDEFSQRIQLDTCGSTISIPKINVVVKHADQNAIPCQVFIVALQQPALIALRLQQHDDLASFAPGPPVVGIEHSSVIASGNFSTSIDAFVVSWSADAFILACVCEGRFKVVRYLQAPAHSKFKSPSQHIAIKRCLENAHRIEVVSYPPSRIESSVSFYVEVHLKPAPRSPMRALLFAYCPTCMNTTMLESGILLISKQLHSRSSALSSDGIYVFSSSSFSSSGQSGRYHYAIAAAGHIFPISSYTYVSSFSSLLHLWAITCFIDCNMTQLDVGREYNQNLPYVNARLVSGVPAPVRGIIINLATQLIETKFSPIVVITGRHSDEYGLFQVASFSILVYKAEADESLFLSAKSDSSTSNLLAINGRVRHCVTTISLCSFIQIVEGLPEHITGGSSFTGTVQATAMSSNGDGVATEVCIFFEGVPAACNSTDLSGNVYISNFFIPFPISFESSALLIWYLGEKLATMSQNITAMKLNCGFKPGCRSFSMASFVMRSGRSLFSVAVSNGHMLHSGVYEVKNSFSVPPRIIFNLTCIFHEETHTCVALSAYFSSVKVVQVQQSLRSAATADSASAQCNYVHHETWTATCAFQQGVLWMHLEVVFGGRVVREIYVHVSDPSMTIEKYFTDWWFGLFREQFVFHNRDFSSPSTSWSSASYQGHWH
jgi:hypothetical protein